MMSVRVLANRDMHVNRSSLHVLTLAQLRTSASMDRRISVACFSHWRRRPEPMLIGFKILVLVVLGLDPHHRLILFMRESKGN